LTLSDYIDINVSCQEAINQVARRAAAHHKENPMSREKSRKRNLVRTIALPLIVLALVLSAAHPAQAQDAKTPYPTMAPLEQYLMDRDAEIALARSAAPPSIAGDAEVMVLAKHGYETAVKGKNSFVCLVERGWASGIDSPDFWNPKLRGPLCLNGPAARTYLPLTIKKTEFVLAGQSKVQMFESLKAAFDKKELPALESGAMCYMLSKDGNLGDGNGAWRPHIMFFVPETEAQTWGANLAASPILAAVVPQDHLTIFMIPVGKWSDGTADHPDGN
jgi:hypothetical protein